MVSYFFMLTCIEVKMIPISHLQQVSTKRTLYLICLLLYISHCRLNAFVGCSVGKFPCSLHELLKVLQL